MGEIPRRGRGGKKGDNNVIHEKTLPALSGTPPIGRGLNI